MSRKKKISITVGLALALGIILMILYFSGVLNSTFFKQLTAPKNGEAVKAFTSYEYTEQHQNGSYSHISICKNNDKYYMVQSYKDVGGQYMYLTSPLDDDAVARWESTLVDFKVADSNDKTDGIYMRGVITFTTNGGSSNYDVVPLDISGYGAIVMELYPDIAPNTVNNFISLIKNGFYDNNSFHRLIPGFVLQGGDPKGDGTGGPGYTIKGEFTNNRFTNTLKHTKGIVSMARSSENDSAGSQFFIMLDTATNLDNNYAAFGKVIDGMDLIDKIASNEVVANSQTGKLKKNLTIKKALVDTKGKEYSEPTIISN